MTSAELVELCTTIGERDALQERVKKMEAAIAQAVVWMAEDGCDCGEGEPGSCALCLCNSLLTK